MNTSLTNREVQEFIRAYSENLNKLAFKGSPFPEVSTQELLEQIDGFRRSQKKLPTWQATFNIIYPHKLNLEQSSSETTANYKAQMISGNKLADLTGGFGVDSYFFSKKFQEVIYFEQNTELAEIVKHNFKVLGAETIGIRVGNALEIIENASFDVIYLDPARRDDGKGKVFRLSDCEPNVIPILDFLKARCTKLLIKTSPMLDLTEGLRELDSVKEIHIVAVQNEVKEVLWLIAQEEAPLIVHTVNITPSGEQRFSYLWNEESHPRYSNPKSFLYEPNHAILKSGGMNHLSERYSVMKLSPNAHLFTSDNHINFPGRVFKIIEQRKYGKGALHDLKQQRAHVTTRDFPESVAQLRKKWKIIEGGDTYLFFTTLMDGSKVVLITEKTH